MASRNIMRGYGAIALLVLLGIGPAAAQSTPDSFLIVPGKSIGSVVVGANIADLAKTLGTPKPAVTNLTSTVLQAPDGATAFAWPVEGSYPDSDKDHGLVVLTDRSGVVFEVIAPAFDKRYQTAEGFHVFDRPQVVIDKLGDPERKPSAGTEMFYVYDHLGIAFQVENGRQYTNYGLINGIRVFAPKT